MHDALHAKPGNPDDWIRNEDTEVGERRQVTVPPTASQTAALPEVPDLPRWRLAAHVSPRG